MKAQIYDALAALNRGFDMAAESLTILQQEGLLNIEYVQDQSTLAEELRADLNYMIVHKLNARELEDREHFGKMRITIEERRSNETTTPTTTGDSGTDASRENGQRTQGSAESPQG